jgi:signal transduction histidine kinase
VEELDLAHPDRSIQFASNGARMGFWDRDRLGQAISNLLANAIEHSPPDTPVRVVLSGDPKVVHIVFHNEGPPIPPDLIRHLFDPFRRGGRSSKGLGLGLYITQQIARAHGGTVEATSDVASGTKFTLRLPRE